MYGEGVPPSVRTARGRSDAMMPIRAVRQRLRRSAAGGHDAKKGRGIVFSVNIYYLYAFKERMVWPRGRPQRFRWFYLCP